MKIVINNPSLEEQLIHKSKELKMKLDDLIEKLLCDNIKEDEFKIDEKEILESIENIKNGNTTEFKSITPHDLFTQIGI